jgi:hypothetical protein
MVGLEERMTEAQAQGILRVLVAVALKDGFDAARFLVNRWITRLAAVEGTSEDGDLKQVAYQFIDELEKNAGEEASGEEDEGYCQCEDDEGHRQ